MNCHEMRPVCPFKKQSGKKEGPQMTLAGRWLREKRFTALYCKNSRGDNGNLRAWSPQNQKTKLMVHIGKEGSLYFMISL
jgi:hypothetical protein